MIRWLYRYVFRGIGILLAIGMITIFFLAINSLSNRSGRSSIPSAKGGQR
jgi:hypothetical protein